MLWFASICIGAYPALLNYNLEANSLLHCLETCESKLLLVSSDEDCQRRIEQGQDANMSMSIKPIVVDANLKAEVASSPMTFQATHIETMLPAKHLFA